MNAFHYVRPLPPKPEQRALCGVRDWVHGTDDATGVTCKKCLRRLALGAK